MNPLRWIPPLELEHDWNHASDSPYSYCGSCGLLDLYNGTIWGWVGEIEGRDKVLCGMCACEKQWTLALHVLSGFSRIDTLCFECGNSLNPYEETRTNLLFPLRAPCDNWAWYWNHAETHSIQMDWHNNFNALRWFSCCRPIDSMIHEFLSVPLKFTRQVFLRKQEEDFYRQTKQLHQRPWIFGYTMVLHVQKEGNFYYRYHHVSRATVADISALTRCRVRYLE